MIKKPICVEDIFVCDPLKAESEAGRQRSNLFSQKHIKRKEYTAVQSFMDDVELMFENAMLFNEEHSQIWEDALTLKVSFCAYTDIRQS